MQSYINSIISGFGITDAIDILIVAFVIYKVLGFIKESRAEQLVKGLLVLVLATFFVRSVSSLHPELDIKRHDDIGCHCTGYCISA